MKKSLLSCSGHFGTVGKRTLYHLSLDRVFEKICPDKKKRLFFLSVLEKPLQCEEDILYRRLILTDFYKDASLLPALKRILSMIAQLKIDHEKEKKEHAHLSRLPYGINVYSALLNILKTHTLTLECVLRLIEELYELLEKSDAVSTGLLNIKQTAKRICVSAAYDEFLEFCSKIKNISSTDPVGLQITLDEKGYICSSILIDHQYIHYTDPNSKSKKKFFYRVDKEIQYPCVVFHAHDQLFTRLSEHALKRLIVKLQALCKHLLALFCDYDCECDYYEVALLYLNTLDEKKINYVYPKTAENYRVLEVRDLMLITELSSVNMVVPYDLTLKDNQKGALLFGENRSGKTVFLRSFGSMQVLFQAGLPVPASSGEMPICNNILTQFSESETERTSNFDVGRFEGEVRELAEIANKLREGDLVLLNETYQTTAYTEGATGLAAFLEYLQRGKIFFVAVSHLFELKKLVSHDTIMFLHSQKNYSISQDTIDDNR